MIFRNGRGTTTLSVDDTASCTDKAVTFGVIAAPGWFDPLASGWTAYIIGLTPEWIAYDGRGMGRVTVRTSPNSRYQGVPIAVPTTFNGRPIT